MTLLYFTLDDKIVKKSIQALCSLTHSPQRSIYPVLVGGIAIQMHCGKELVQYARPTCDMDLLYLPPIRDFKHFEEGIGGELASEIKNAKYQVQLKKQKNRSLYEVKVMNGQGNRAKELFFIHFDKLSPEVESRSRHISEREVDNAIEMNFGDKYCPITVKRIEDILTHKLKRIDRIMQGRDVPIAGLEKSLYSLANSGRWSEIAPTALEPWLGYILEMQNALGVGETNLPPVYVLNKDLYDVTLISRMIEGRHGFFNRAYFEKAKAELNKASKRGSK